MTRKEIFCLMMHLTGGTLDQCENHYDYLISRKKMSELKNHGHIQRAQQTTTKRSCIRIEHQFCWHMTIEPIWEDHWRFRNLLSFSPISKSRRWDGCAWQYRYSTSRWLGRSQKAWEEYVRQSWLHYNCSNWECSRKFWAVVLPHQTKGAWKG